MEGFCRKCGKRKDIRELYGIIIISRGYTNTFGERDCRECRETTKKGEKVSN